MSLGYTENLNVFVFRILFENTKIILFQVLILEDDVGFYENFHQRLQNILNDVNRLDLPWDFIYIGRNLVGHKVYNEKYVGVLPSCSLIFSVIKHDLML